MEFTGYDDNKRARSAEAQNGFTRAAFACGLISVFSCMLILVSVPVGSLGVVFALLSRTDRLPLRGRSKKALLLSLLGIVASTLIFILMVMMVVKSYGGWEPFIKEYIEYYETVTGQSWNTLETFMMHL